MVSFFTAHSPGKAGEKVSLYRFAFILANYKKKGRQICDRPRAAKTNATPLRLFCLDQTGTTTVQKPKRVLALKGSKQLNKVTSGEPGTLVTTCRAVSATGNALPPAMVFPRKNFKSPMLKGAPIGTLGIAQPTGWMNTELFPQVIKHFVKVTGSSKTNPSLFILDNHDSHIALEALNIAKENGMTLLTIPPHSSHKLQPLDVSVFGPLQNYYNAAIDS